MVVSLFYEMQSPCNCFTLSVCVSDSYSRNSWRDDNDATMKIKVSSVGAGFLEHKSQEMTRVSSPATRLLFPGGHFLDTTFQAITTD